MNFDRIPDWLESRQAEGLYRRRRVIANAQGRELLVDDNKLLNFCSNDYLGLANDARICQAFEKAVARWGVGSGGSHLICGHTTAHHELEEALAEFVGRPRALLFSSGYAANVGTINALLTVGDHIYQDRLNHASLLDGGWISRARFTWFNHQDTQHLDQQLAEVSDDQTNRLIVSDGTFSMDGDLCRLDELVSIARQHKAWVMIDDAHGIGVHGRQGCGLVDSARYSTVDVPVLMGTLGKAFGTAGAFVAGEESLIEFLIQRARNYIFTTAIPSAVAVATLEALKIVQQEQWRRDHLSDLIAQFRHGAQDIGFNISNTQSPIQPLVVGAPAMAVNLSKRLEDMGILITAIRPPTVPEGTSRLRITLTAAHTSEDVKMLLNALADVYPGEATQHDS